MAHHCSVLVFPLQKLLCWKFQNFLLRNIDHVLKKTYYLFIHETAKFGPASTASAYQVPPLKQLFYIVTPRPLGMEWKGIKNDDVDQTWKFLSLLFPSWVQANIRMVVSPLQNGPSNTHGFVPDGQSYRPGKVTAQTPIETTVFGLRIKSSKRCACTLNTVVCGGWNLVIA